MKRIWSLLGVGIMGVALLYAGAVFAAEGTQDFAQMKNQALSKAKRLVDNMNDTIRTARNRIKSAKKQETKVCMNEKLISMLNVMKNANKAYSDLKSCTDSACVDTKITIVENAFRLVQSLMGELDRCSGEEVRFGTEEKEQREVIEDPAIVGDDAMESTGDPNDANPPTVADRSSLSDEVSAESGSGSEPDVSPDEQTPGTDPSVVVSPQ